MAAMSDYLEGKIGDHLFRTPTFAKPSAIYVALFTTLQNDAGLAGVEVAGGSYARVAVAQLDANWNAPTAGDGLVNNITVVAFPAPTANWGVIVGLAVYDALTGGNLLIHSALTASKTINSGDPGPEFSAGALNFTFA